MSDMFEDFLVNFWNEKKNYLVDERRNVKQVADRGGGATRRRCSSPEVVKKMLRERCPLALLSVYQCPRFIRLFIRLLLAST